MNETAKDILAQMNFPNQYDVIREEAERFQKLSSEDKLRSIAELMALGSGIDTDPHEEIEAWRLAVQSLIARYKAKQGLLDSCSVV